MESLPNNQTNVADPSLNYFTLTPPINIYPNFTICCDF